MTTRSESDDDVVPGEAVGGVGVAIVAARGVVMARSALRVADQVAGRFPDRCVLSGAETIHAVRMTATQWAGPRWLLGVPGFARALGLLPRRRHHTVALPVSDRVWRMWRCRNLVGLTALTAGVTFSGIGLVTEVVGLVVFGVVVFTAAMAYRTRAHHNYWVTCRFRPAEATIVVEPTHARFDEAARDLFVRPLDKTS